MDKLWYLSQISIFKALPKEDLMKIEKISHMSIFPKKTVIQTPDNFRQALYVLKKGKLRLYKINSKGKQFTLSILGSGNVFGEIESFSLGTREVYIETLEETIVCTISQELIKEFILVRPELMLKLMGLLSERLAERNKMLEQMALADTKKRLLYLLVKLSEQFGVKKDGKVKIDLQLSHQELANMIGSTRESVSIMLKALSKQKIIRTGRMSITLDYELAKETFDDLN